MKRNYIFFMVVLITNSALAILPPRATKQAESIATDGLRKDAVLNGILEPKTDSLWQSVVRLRLVTKFDEKTSMGMDGGSCTASFIAEDTLLTAAHCFIDQNNGSVTKVVGLSVTYFDGDQPRDKKESLYLQDSYTVAIYPGYTAKVAGDIRNADNDIALVRFRGSILPDGFKVLPTMTPDISEFRSMIEVGQPIIMVGAGRTSKDSIARFLEKSVGTINGFGKASIWTRGNDNREGICAGDSGGPLIARMKNGKYVILGVLSRFDIWPGGLSTPSCSAGGGYTMLMDAQHVDWFLRNIPQTE